MTKTSHAVVVFFLWNQSVKAFFFSFLYSKEFPSEARRGFFFYEIQKIPTKVPRHWGGEWVSNGGGRVGQAGCLPQKTLRSDPRPTWSEFIGERERGNLEEPGVETSRRRAEPCCITEESPNQITLIAELSHYRAETRTHTSAVTQHKQWPTCEWHARTETQWRNIIISASLLDRRSCESRLKFTVVILSIFRGSKYVMSPEVEKIIHEWGFCDK